MDQRQHIDHSESNRKGFEQHLELLVAEKARLEAALNRPLEALHIERATTEDQAPLLHEQFLSIRQHNFAHTTLKQIEGSLERLRNGVYGICERCDEAIAEKRLKAVPWTPFCLGCQEKLTSQRLAA